MSDTVQPDRRRWIGLVFISIAVALIIVDSTIVNVAIPSIVDELGITSTQVQWVQESYTLVFASLLLVFGTLADRFGRRRVLIIGVVIFALASILAALSPSGELLIASRLVQGVGGAMILPSSLSMINSTFRGKERAVAFAVWGSTIGGMAAVGPLLGGWLTTYFSWRWAFGINIPLSVIIVIGVLAFALESREHGAPRRVDIVGAALSVVLFASLVFGLIEGRTFGWFFSDTPPSFWSFGVSPIPFVFALTLVSLAAFIAWGLRRERAGRSTMLAFGLLRISSFRNGNIAAMIVSLGEFGIILSLPLWLQNVLGYDALHTGLVILALAIGSFVASGFAGAFGNRIAPVLIVRVGIIADDRGGCDGGALHQPRSPVVADCAGPLRLRFRCRKRDRPADGSRADGCSGRAERAGFWHTVERPAGRLSARYRHPRNHPLRLARGGAHCQARQPTRDPAGDTHPDRGCRRRLGGHGDPRARYTISGCCCRCSRSLQRLDPVCGLRGRRLSRAGFSRHPQAR